MIRLAKISGNKLRRGVRCDAVNLCVHVASSTPSDDVVVNTGRLHSSKVMSTVTLTTLTGHISHAADNILEKSEFSSTPAPKLYDLLSNTSQATHNSKKKHHQKKKKIQPSSSNHVASIPKQSSYTTRVLFDSIAPHIEFRTLHQLIKQLSYIISRGRHKFDVSDVNAKKHTIKSRFGMLFGPESNQCASLSSEEYSWSIKGHKWIEPLIYQYFMGKHLDVTQIRKAADDDKTYPPNQNRRNYKKNLTTLMKARQVCLRHPIFWTEKLMRESGYSFSKNAQRDHLTLKYQKEISRLHSLQDEELLQDDAEHLMKLLMVCLPPPHFDKVMKSLEHYTKLDDDDVAESSHQSWYIDDENDGNSSSTSARNKSVKGGKIPILGSFLGASSSSHSHLVAVELGRFLYVQLPTPEKDRTHKVENRDEKEATYKVKNGDIYDSSEDSVMSTSSNTSYALRKHRKLYSADKRYQKTKEDFVKKMMELQHEFAAWDGKSEGGSSASNISDSASDDTGTIVCSGSDDLTDLQVKEFEKEQQPYNADARKIQKKELAETLAELRRMGSRTEEGDIPTIIGRGRPRKGIHLRFTAVRMEDSSVDALVSPHSPPTESDLEHRIVFVNNLPIDTTEEEIHQIYSRCGQLDSIQLFNLRPDLDPGPLTKAQVTERRRNSRLTNKYSNELKFQQQRPRTPVYGMLTFKDAEGFKTATCPELSIFGCVIRRHPVMSIKAQNVTTLYLENIPQNLYSMDVEYKLARCLHPHQVYVMLDGMKGVGKHAQNGNNQEYSEPASCEVAFENFQTAMQAYNWIRTGAEGSGGEGTNVTLMGGEECQLHWFRTPVDGIKYWTRELFF